MNLYYYHPIKKSFIDTLGKTIPVIFTEAGNSKTLLLLKNTSNKVYHDISITRNAVQSCSMAVSSSSAEPESYTSSLTYSHTILYPGESLFIHVKSTKVQNITIDYSSFTLDVTYSDSLIDIVNLEAFFEFVQNDTSDNTFTESTYSHRELPEDPFINASITNGIKTQSVVSQSRKAFFRNNGDQIFFTAPNSATEATFYFNLIANDTGTSQPIVYTDNFEIGLSAQRKIYISLFDGVDTNVVTFAKELLDYNQEYKIALAVSSSLNLELLINKEIIPIESRSTEQLAEFIMSPSEQIYLGTNTSEYLKGSIGPFAYYSEHHSIAKMISTTGKL